MATFGTFRCPPIPRADAAGMPLVRVRVVLGKSLLAEPTWPVAADVSVQVIVEEALEPHHGMELEPTWPIEVFKDAGGKERTAQLPISKLGVMTVGELHLEGYGTNLVAHVRRTAAARAGGSSTSPSTPADKRSGSSSLPNSLEGMMEQEVRLPPRAVGKYLNHTIFNALLDELNVLSLGWHYSDAIGSGNILLKALSSALQYALPFDNNGALARRAIHIPERFKLGHLKVCMRTPQTQQLSLSATGSSRLFCRRTLSPPPTCVLFPGDPPFRQECGNKYRRR